MLRNLLLHFVQLLPSTQTYSTGTRKRDESCIAYIASQANQIEMLFFSYYLYTDYKQKA